MGRSVLSSLHLPERDRGPILAALFCRRLAPRDGQRTWVAGLAREPGKSPSTGDWVLWCHPAAARRFATGSLTCAPSTDLVSRSETTTIRSETTTSETRPGGRGRLRALPFPWRKTAARSPGRQRRRR